MNEYDISEIYKTYSPKVINYLSRFVGKDDAEDLKQEVFSSLISFKGDSQLSTWIYKIATNTAIDKLKNSAFRNEKSKKTSLDYVEHLIAKDKTDYSETDIEYGFLKKR